MPADMLARTAVTWFHPQIKMNHERGPPAWQRRAGKHTQRKARDRSALTCASGANWRTMVRLELMAAAPGPSHMPALSQCHVHLVEKESRAPCIANVTYGCSTESKTMCASHCSRGAPHRR